MGSVKRGGVVSWSESTRFEESSRVLPDRLRGCSRSCATSSLRRRSRSVTTSLCSCSERNMMTEFHVERIVRADGVRLVLSGELDLAGTDRLLSAGENIPEGGTLTLDLSGLSFMDSSGLKVFMNLDRRSRREGWSLVIENPRGQVLRLLQLCGFEQRLPITPR